MNSTSVAFMCLKKENKNLRQDREVHFKPIEIFSILDIFLAGPLIMVAAI